MGRTSVRRAPAGRALVSLCVAVVGAFASLAAFGCGNSGDPFDLLPARASVPVQFTRPQDQEVGVSVNTLVTIAFPADLDVRSVHPSTFVLLGANGLPVGRSVSYDPGSRVVTIRPNRALTPSALHQVNVQGVRPATGDFIFRPLTFTFATGDDPQLGAPEVVAVMPVPGQANVNVNASIKVVFSEEMDQPSVQQAFSISDGVAGSISFDTTGREMTFTPGAPLPLGRTLVLQVSRQATDVDGVPLRVGFSSTFSTPRADSFRVLESIPRDGATTASPSTMLQFTFSEPVDRSTVTTNFEILASGLALPVPTDGNFDFLSNDQIVVYDPSVAVAGFVGLPGGSSVIATFNREVSSAISGLGLPRDFVLDFTVENIPPQVVATDPVNGETGVAGTQIIRFDFNEPLDPATVNSTTFSVTQGPVVTGVITFENDFRTVVFTPNNPFQNAASPVQVTATTGITDRGGTGLAANITVSFNIDQIAPFLSESFPDPTQPGGTVDVPVTLFPERRLRFRINEPIDQARTLATFMITPDSAGGTIAFPDSRTLTYIPPNQQPSMADQPTPPDQRLLTGATDYTVTFTAFDLAGNNSAVSLMFRTDDDPPTPAMFGPTGVSSTTTTVFMVFDELVDKRTVMNAVTFRQTAPVVQNIMVTPAVNDTGFTFTPPTLPSPGSFEVTVAASLTDLGGVPLAGPEVFTFSTN